MLAGAGAGAPVEAKAAEGPNSRHHRARPLEQKRRKIKTNKVKDRNQVSNTHGFKFHHLYLLVSACTVEIVFVKDNATVSSTIDARRRDYAVAALNRVKSTSNVNAQAALVESSTSGQATVVRGLQAIPGLVNSFKGNSGSSSASRQPLTQTLNGQFGQYSAANVNRYVVFLVTSKSLQYAIDVSTQLRSHGVTVFAVSCLDDKSSDFSKALSSMAQDSSRIYYVPPSSGDQLGRALSKC